MIPTPPFGPDLFRNWLESARLYRSGAYGAERVLVRAAQRSAGETRAIIDATSKAGGKPDLANLARLGDLARAQWFLWTGANLAAGERAGRALARPSAFTWSPRTLVLGLIASDLYLGYGALRERARWYPGLVDSEDWELQHRRGAGRLLDAAEALGGTLIKAGQFASTRPDLLPTAYTGTLSTLQDRVPPQPWVAIRGAVEQELGRPLAEVFTEFDEEPLAAASIAQVHRARLTDGREVAVKVQYPGIAGLIEADLSALDSIFGAVARLEPGIHLQPIADYLRWTLPLELDFRHEAQSIADLREALRDREDVVIPEVMDVLSTGRLLVMELVEGIKVTERDALVAAGIEPTEVAKLLNDVYADQLFRRGILHADPHPGNLLVQPGPRLVLLDHGLTLALDPSFVAALDQLVLSLRGGDLDALVPALREAGLPLGEDTDLDTLLAVVGILLGGERDDNSSDFGQFGRKLGASVGNIPPQLLLVGRAIGLLDGITRQLDPDLDALEIVARYTKDS